jgi:hypothetical protein
MRRRRYFSFVVGLIAGGIAGGVCSLINILIFSYGDIAIYNYKTPIIIIGVVLGALVGGAAGRKHIQIKCNIDSEATLSFLGTSIALWSVFQIFLGVAYSFFTRSIGVELTVINTVGKIYKIIWNTMDFIPIPMNFIAVILIIVLAFPVIGATCYYFIVYIFLVIFPDKAPKPKPCAKSIIQSCKQQIDSYLENNDNVTLHFQSKLRHISNQLNSIEEKSTYLTYLITYKFAGATHSKFISPIDPLLNMMVGVANSLLNRSKLHSAMDYNRLAIESNQKEASEAYKQYEQEDVTLAEEMCAEFDNAVLDMVSLSRELLRIEEPDIEKIREVLNNFGSLIQDIKLYCPEER